MWISATIATFLAIPPSNDLFARGKMLAAFAGFVVAVLTGLILVAGREWNGPQHAWAWGTCSALSLVLSITGFLTYNYLIGKWTTIYDNQRIVIGSALTPIAQEAVNHNPGMTIEQLIFDADGRFDLVWMRDSVLYNAMYLLAAYMIAVISLTICLLSLLHAFNCRGRNKGAVRPQKDEAASYS